MAAEKKSRRALLVDPRFAIGVLLVVLSVLGVVTLVNSANASVEVLAARTTLTPGQRVHADDLVPTSVRVGRTAQLYLTAVQVPPSGVILTRAVAAGELVPRSAVGRSGGRSRTSMVVTVSGDLAQAVVPGARVDLWSSPDENAITPSDTSSNDSSSADPDAASPMRLPPSVLVSSALVVRILESKQLVASAGTSVELLVPKADAASVLDAIAAGATLTVLPVDLPLGN